MKKYLIGKTSRRGAIGLLLGLTCLTGSVAAQSAGADLCTAPSIELIVPWPAGGGTDAQGRLIAAALSTRIGKQVVVVNRPGAGGVVGTTAFVHSAKPDGCSLIMVTGATNATAPYIYKDLQFKPIDDFTPIAFIAAAPNVLYVNAKSSYTTVQQLIDDAKAQPAKLTYASGGTGASSHLAGALFATAAGIDIVHIPYKGAAPAIADLLGGHVTLSVDTGSQLGHVKSGGLRALAVASKQRLVAMPDTPTFDELGIPGVYSAFWGGIAGPKGMSDAMVKRLNREINEALKTEKVRDTLLGLGSELTEASSPQAFLDFWKSELVRYEEIVRISGAAAQ